MDLTYFELNFKVDYDHDSSFNIELPEH